MSSAGQNWSQAVESGPFILRPLLENVQLEDEETDGNAAISCVEFWNDNLYIGTSHGDLLHYVLLPAAPGEANQGPSFIQASRQKLEANGPGPHAVRQILVVPQSGKACILCDTILRFYVLPELSPANGFPVQVPNCTWVGGVDLSLTNNGASAEEGVEVLVGTKDRLRLIKVGEKARQVAAMQLGGSIAFARREVIACVADSTSYSLLDVKDHQRIPLFNVNTAALSPTVPVAENEETAEAATSSRENEESQGNNTTPSQDTEVPSESAAESSKEEVSVHLEGLSPAPEEHAQQPSPNPLSGKETSNASATEHSSSSHQRSKSVLITQSLLKPELRPHITSPTPNEFLLTTGTTLDDPGVGMFVGLDGEVSRGTLDFSRYPIAIVSDGQGIDPLATSSTGLPAEEGYVLALVSRGRDDHKMLGLEIQRWDAEGEEAGVKNWLQFPYAFQDTNGDYAGGLRSAATSSTLYMADAVAKLQRIRHGSSGETQDADLYDRICSAEPRILAWQANHIWWIVRTPLVIRLDSRLQSALQGTQQSSKQQRRGLVRPHVVEAVINDLRGQEPRSELEFFSIQYIRQKASLLLFLNLLHQNLANATTYERDRRVVFEALTSGEIDPRVIVSTIPVILVNVFEGRNGFWLTGGIEELLQTFLAEHELPGEIDLRSPLAADALDLTKAYLFHWRRKKGFASVADEEDVSKSVDAALLHTLLILDSETPVGHSREGSVRKELYAVVDGGVSCYERAVSLLESYGRLYVLSRLHQSRKESTLVLHTWRRIIESEPDHKTELGDGEQRMRTYLTSSNVRDRTLFEEYACWLANRNPRVGVLVFADENSKVRFSPREALDLLRERAPGAVKYFLEHLVFGKNLAEYANNLIGHYLDGVLEKLEEDQSTRQILLDSYATYRALRPPKPTYSQFVADHGPDAEWWRNRLRLLQLLGGSHGAASQYDTAGSLARIEPFKEELVPETIILGGRQGRHADALRLLTHSLADYDTAISYCVLGGSSTYSQMTTAELQQARPTREQQRMLFGLLLEEFFKIEDTQDRITQTTELLERFAGWFDILKVLPLIPDTWAVEHFAGFLQSAIRQLLAEKNEALVTRALSSTQNLQVSSILIEKLDTFKPRVEHIAEPG